MLGGAKGGLVARHQPVAERAPYGRSRTDEFLDSTGTVPKPDREYAAIEASALVPYFSTM